MALKCDIFPYSSHIPYSSGFIISVCFTFLLECVFVMYKESDNSLKAVKKTVKEEKLEYEYTVAAVSTIDKRKLCENYCVGVLKSGK